MDSLDTRAKMRAAVHADMEDEQFAAVSKLSQVRDRRVAPIMKHVVDDPRAAPIVRNVARDWLRGYASQHAGES
jgi:hypothetical protein